MFEFENFSVYKKSKNLFSEILKVLENRSLNKNLKDQLYRSTSSIILNIAEGAGKYSKRDKKNFYTIARGSVHETVAILDILDLEDKINKKTYALTYSQLEEISKMLSG